MTPFRLRTDLQRVVLNGFALPLGIAPAPGRLKPPEQGYTLAFVPGEDDDPDSYSFHVVVSHEKVAAVVHRAFQFLPEEVSAIVEIGSRDAYRSTDVFISDEPIPRDEFLAAWSHYEPLLLEDSAIAAGANSDEPFVEVFVDQLKAIAIHVSTDLRDEVEQMLQEFGLEEVAETWTDPLQADRDHAGQVESVDDDAEFSAGATLARQVLDLQDEFAPDIDEILLDLRHLWRLQLNVDPTSNVDEVGRHLGPTLWHAVVIIDRVRASTSNGETGLPVQSAYASIWATAGSLDEMEDLIEQAMTKHSEWQISDIYTIDRVAFDERPDELAHLRPSQRESKVHLVSIEQWGDQPKPEG